MHKFGTAPAMIKQIVTRLAGAYRVDAAQVQILLRDLNRRLDSENPYTFAPTQLSPDEGKVQQIVNRLMRGDLSTMRAAVTAVLASEQDSSSSNNNTKAGKTSLNRAGRSRDADPGNPFAATELSVTDEQLKAAIAAAIRTFHA
jgi:hypothetical protein